MRSVMNVSLPKELKKWVDQQVRAGDYGTASEYVRDMLRQARQRQMRRHLDEMLIQSIDSGANIPMNQSDWTSIRRSARSAAKACRSKP